MMYDKSIKQVFRDLAWDMAKNGMYGTVSVKVSKSIMQRLADENGRDHDLIPPCHLSQWSYGTGMDPETTVTVEAQ